jgi:hypothetical protein
MPIGGFNLADALSQYNDVANLGYNIRQRGRRIQDEDAADQNAMPGYLEDLQAFRQKMGPEYQDDPATLQQLRNRHFIRGAPGQADQAAQTGANLAPVVRQKRKMDLKNELAESMQKFAATRAKNKTLQAAMDDPRNMIPPEVKKFMMDSQKSQEMELLQAYQRSLRMGYSDVWNEPDVQEMVTQSIASGLLGPTNVAPGGGGFQMPDTSLPQLQTQGLLGGMGGGAQPRNGLIDRIDARRGR